MKKQLAIILILLTWSFSIIGQTQNLFQVNIKADSSIIDSIIISKLNDKDIESDYFFTFKLNSDSNCIAIKYPKYNLKLIPYDKNSKDTSINITQLTKELSNTLVSLLYQVTKKRKNEIFEKKAVKFDSLGNYKIHWPEKNNNEKTSSELLSSQLSNMLDGFTDDFDVNDTISNKKEEFKVDTTNTNESKPIKNNNIENNTNPEYLYYKKRMEEYINVDNPYVSDKHRNNIAPHILNKVFEIFISK